VGRLDLRPHHRNARGVAHGGVVSSLVDSTLGAAVISSIPQEWWCATVSLSVQYLGGAREGPLEATARVLRRGRRVALAEGEPRDGRGRVVARARGEPRTFAKGFDTSAPVSLVVPREAVSDESALVLGLDVNGTRRQEARAGQMLRPVPELVSLLSRRLTLEPGDLIFTGTPSGAASVRPGDLLEVRLQDLVSLRVTVESGEDEGA
jgi:uncharacterized protein (TIGR00369 family)